jgi:tungstate transport system ATP-binding protein
VSTGLLLDVRNVRVALAPRHDVPLALDGVSLQILQGERVALVGANGSGKSTLLRVLHSLQKPLSGCVEVMQPAPQAMLFQRPVLLRFSVQNNLALGFWLKGMPWRDARLRALQVLSSAGLSDVAYRKGRQLSVGQTQRVALARALALAPEILLLDEPTASLDPHSKILVEATVQGFAGTMVFASHNLGQVKRLATRVVYLEHGRALANLPVAAFFNRNQLQAHSAEAASFMKGEGVL